MATQQLTVHADDHKGGMTLDELEAWCARMRAAGASGAEQARARVAPTFKPDGGGIRSLVLHVHQATR